MTKDEEIGTNNKRLKIAYIHHCPEKGGASKSLCNLIKSFPPDKIDPIVLCPRGPVIEMFANASINVCEITPLSEIQDSSGTPLKGRRLLLLLRTLIRLKNNHELISKINKINPDIVHINERGLIFTARIIKKSGYPVVMHARNVPSNEVRWANELSNRLINRYVDRVIAIDGSVRNSLKGIKRIDVVYNQYNLKDLPARLKKNTRKKIRLLFLSNLMACKGIWDLVEAIKIMGPRDDYILEIVGGNSRPPEFFKSFVGKVAAYLGFVQDIENQIKDYIKNERLEGNIEMLGFTPNIVEVIKDSDINIFPSHLNGPSRSVFETGIYGIPSIISLKDKIEDVVVNNVTGFVVQDNNPKELADAIEKLINSEDLRVRMGENAREKYSRQFHPKKNMEKVLSIYQMIADGSHP